MVEVGHPGLPAVAHVHLELVGTVKLSKLLGQVACNLNHRREEQRLTSLASGPGLGVHSKTSVWGAGLHGVYEGLHGVYEGLHWVYEGLHWVYEGLHWVCEGSTRGL